MLTVGLSVLLHGLSAAWGARRYAAWYERASSAGVALAEAGLEGELRGRLRMTAGRSGEPTAAPGGD
jgi:hypothetical protein